MSAAVQHLRGVRNLIDSQAQRLESGRSDVIRDDVAKAMREWVKEIDTALSVLSDEGPSATSSDLYQSVRFVAYRLNALERWADDRGLRHYPADRDVGDILREYATILSKALNAQAMVATIPEPTRSDLRHMLDDAATDLAGISPRNRPIIDRLREAMELLEPLIEGSGMTTSDPNLADGAPVTALVEDEPRVLVYDARPPSERDDVETAFVNGDSRPFPRKDERGRYIRDDAVLKRAIRYLAEAVEALIQREVNEAGQGRNYSEIATAGRDEAIVQLTACYTELASIEKETE
jgi:hypothetical protein